MAQASTDVSGIRHTKENMTAYTQDDIMLTLSYLRGERTVPTQNVEGRKDFIQTTLNQIYDRHPWAFARVVNQSVAVASSIASLPSGLSLAHQLHARYQEGSTEIALEEIDASDRFNAQEGDRVYWLEPRGEGQYNLATKEAIANVIVDYSTTAPQVNATITTPFPDKQTIALGANRYVKLSQDPEADISQDEALFENRLTQNIGDWNLNRPMRKLRTRQSEVGYRTGDF